MLEAIKFLDTAVQETGDSLNIEEKRRLPAHAHFQSKVAFGDTLVIEGRVSTDADWIILGEITTSQVQKLELASFVRARRTVDGGVGESEIWLKHFKQEGE